MLIRVNNHLVDLLSPRYVNKELIIGIDSSKTNSAFTVRDINGNVLDVIEFNGKDDGTEEQDVLELCLVQRRVMAELFRGAKPRIVGIENIITKNDKRKEMGISTHMSRFKITAVFMSFISFFQDTFNITPELVNNQTWKATTLPEEFRRREYAKGSLAYQRAINSKYQFYSDDATDSLCISEYLCIAHNIKRGFQIGEAELARNLFEYWFESVDRGTNCKHKYFIPNKSLTVVQNITVVSNHIKTDEVGVFDVPTFLVELEDIYKRCQGIFKVKEDTLRAVVKLQ